MALFDFFGGFGGWSWIVTGLILLGVELLVPGGIFVWLGIAGVLTGIVALQIGMSWPVQWLVFILLSFGSVFVWRAYRKSRPDDSDLPFLNKRAHRYLGETHTLTKDVLDGRGELTLDDTIWRIRANHDDISAGKQVRIVGADGSILLVEAS